MTKFEICFNHPWLLLLLIPALLFTFVPYFRIKKRYRRTRNRVVSIVLHSIVMTLAILMLAGFTIRYELPNKDNQLLLVVDSSYSNQEEKDNKEEKRKLKNNAYNILSGVNKEALEKYREEKKKRRDG